MSLYANKYEELRGWLERRKLSQAAEPSSSYDAEMEYCDDSIAKLCIGILQQGGHVLTHEEQEALKISTDLANAVRAIIVHGTDDGIQTFDWQEAAMKIHDIQHMIMAQAAARLFPEQYRLLGSRLKR